MARTALRPYSSRVFTPNWWDARRNLWNHRWHYCHHRPWWWWWSRPRWGAVVIWVDNDWDDAWAYEYDDNVVFEDDAVYINESPVATAEDYVEGAGELSGVAAPADDAEIEWMPLGVFAMATSAEDKNPNMMIQLVLAKDGRVGGDYYHIKTDSSRAIHGSLDEETQRIAFKIGEKSRNVLEVGLEGLTRDEAPIWVHFENGKRTQTWTLIRLEEPEEAKTERAKAGATGGQ